MAASSERETKRLKSEPGEAAEGGDTVQAQEEVEMKA